MNLEMKMNSLLQKLKDGLRIFDSEALVVVDEFNSRVNQFAKVNVYETYNAIIDKLASTFHKLRTNMIILLP